MPEFPQLAATPFWLGHLPEMQRDTYGFYRRYHKDYGRFLRFRALPGIPFYSFTDPAAFEHILIKERSRYTRGVRWRKAVGCLGGNGLVTSNGDFWHRQRQKMSPFFHSRMIQNYVDIVTRNTQEIVAQIRRQPQGALFNISDTMMFLGLINVSDALFGYDIRSEATTFSVAMQDCFAHIQNLIVNPLSAPSFLPTGNNRKFKRSLAVADRVARTIIGRKREQDEPTLINALIRTGGLTNRQFRDEIVTLLMAGHDTTATALAWAWYLLARHRDILHVLQDELKSVLGGKLPTASDIEKLPYTRMVFEEVLRLYPSVWALHRFAHEDDEVAGYAMKKGSSIALPVYVAHRDPAHWQHPEEFFPEHFSKDATAQRPRHVYLPFGAGERFCIGSQFALIEGILVLATLCQEIAPTLLDENIHPTIAFTLKPDRPIIAVRN